MRFKILILFLLIFVLVFPIVLGDDDITVTPTSGGSDKPAMPTSDTSVSNDSNASGSLKFSNDTRGFIKNVSDATKTAFDTGINAGINESDVPPMKLPSVLHKPTKVFFGVKNEGSITLEKFIVLVCLFIIFLIALYEMVSISSFQESVSWIISLGLVVIISITGQINKIGDKIIYYGEGLKIVSFLPDWYYIILVIGVGVLVIILFKYLKMFIRKIQLERQVDANFKKGFRHKVAQEKIETSSSVFDVD